MPRFWISTLTSASAVFFFFFSAAAAAAAAYLSAAPRLSAVVKRRSGKQFAGFSIRFFLDKFTHSSSFDLPHQFCTANLSTANQSYITARPLFHYSFSLHASASTAAAATAAPATHCAIDSAAAYFRSIKRISMLHGKFTVSTHFSSPSFDARISAFCERFGISPNFAAVFSTLSIGAIIG